MTWRHIEFRSCAWPVDMVSTQRNICESILACEVKLSWLSKHTNTRISRVPFQRVVKLFASRSRTG